MTKFELFLHYYTLLAPWLIASFLPSLITGLSNFPDAGGAVKWLKKALDFLSFVSHANSSGTFKLPLSSSKNPEQE